MEEIKNGVISEIYGDKDYELAGADSIQKLPIAPNRFNGIQYHQPDISDMSCTMHGCLTAFSSLTGYKFSDNQRLEIWELCKKQGASDKYGFYLNKAVDIVRDYVNKLEFSKFVTFRVAIGFDEYYEVMKKGYMVVTGYNGNSKWNEDKKDGVLENTEFGASTYSHIIASYDNSPQTKNEVTFVDSYVKTSPKNIYKIPDIIPLYQNNTIFKYGYVFAYDEVLIALNTKLIQRLEDRLVYCPDVDKFGIVKNGKLEVFAGKHISETFRFKYKNTNESYTLGLNLKDFKSIGFKN
jgi:hypothetical protein